MTFKPWQMFQHCILVAQRPTASCSCHQSAVALWGDLPTTASYWQWSSQVVNCQSCTSIVVSLVAIHLQAINCSGKMVFYTGA